MYHFVYKLTNKLNNNFYIGKHSTDDVDDGYLGSGTYLNRVINKLGPESFDREILKFFETSEEAYEYEKSLITPEMVLSRSCYNLTGGGKGWGHGASSYVYIQIAENRHPMKLMTDRGENPSALRVKDGTHQWLDKSKNPSSIASKNGTHKLLGIKPWDNFRSTELSKYTWSVADKIYEFYTSNNRVTRTKVVRLYSKTYNKSISWQSVRNMIDKFKRGWIPSNDSDWISFKQEYDLARE